MIKQKLILLNIFFSVRLHLFFNGVSKSSYSSVHPEPFKEILTLRCMSGGSLRPPLLWFLPFTQNILYPYLNLSKLFVADAPMKTNRKN